MEKYFINKTLETGMVQKDEFKREQFVVVNSFTIESIKPTMLPDMTGTEVKFYTTVGCWAVELGVSPRVDFDEKTLNELYKNNISIANFPVVGKVFWRLKQNIN